jgi:pimeloyl-ACP methyl ester carboxylesterase
MGDQLARPPAEIDPDRFAIHAYHGRGFRLAYIREGVGGVPLLCVHGWPETKRIWWRVIQPLVDAGFEVIVPDLRGFGDSDDGPDGFHDVVVQSADLQDLVVRGLGHQRVVVCGGDLGGAVIQELALRFPELVERMVLFNSPLPYNRDTMAHLRTRSSRKARDYYVRQGTDADGLIAELDTPDKRRRYVGAFYTWRGWAHPGAFAPGSNDAESEGGSGSPVVDFHTAPFADRAKLRASFGPYEAVFSEAARSQRPLFGPNPDVEVLVLFGPSDQVVPPDFDRMATLVFPRHLGPFLIRDCGHFVPWEAPHILASATQLLCRDLLGEPRTHDQ